ncbi:MAG: hypothetical protein PHZ19_10895 [Candidatus Thermoplasmatota archaeon]|nr:hypothetical protein [Candidatus Thermoplasmatota archaeon]
MHGLHVEAPAAVGDPLRPAEEEDRRHGEHDGGQGKNQDHGPRGERAQRVVAAVAKDGPAQRLQPVRHRKPIPHRLKRGREDIEGKDHAGEEIQRVRLPLSSHGHGHW